jgi:hydroxycarboxylate dehydrogenase B
MSQSSSPATLISATELRSVCARILRALGSADAEAQAVADNLVMANLCGHDSHGVGMLPRYVDAVLEGGLQPNTGVRVNLDAGTLLALDGQRGFGQVVGEQAMQMGIARAQQHGSCIMTLSQAHHLGRIGHWAEMAVAQGLVSIHFVNVLSRPIVASWGGADGRFGTNPCCIGVPLEGREPSDAGQPQDANAPSGGSALHAVKSVGEHFILDFATSRVAQGKMRVAYNEGRQVEPGFLIDQRGYPTTDPGVVVVPKPDSGASLFGALLPFGEYKGYGLAVACELLGGALTGGGTMHRPADTRRSVYNGMLTILIDPKRLGTQEAFAREAMAFVDWLRQGPVAPGADAVRLAGEPERAYRKARERDGIVIDATTWAEIGQAASKAKISL